MNYGLPLKFNLISFGAGDIFPKFWQWWSEFISSIDRLIQNTEVDVPYEFKPPNFKEPA